MFYVWVPKSNGTEILYGAYELEEHARAVRDRLIAVGGFARVKTNEGQVDVRKNKARGASAG